jgi:hypothetical protein
VNVPYAQLHHLQCWTQWPGPSICTCEAVSYKGMTCLNIQTSLARLWMAVVVFHKDIHCYQSGVLISRRFVVNE